jgi:hypothetical protein
MVIFFLKYILGKIMIYNIKEKESINLVDYTVR